jgi:hypothetical protein
MLAAERGIMENDVWLWLTRLGALAGFVALLTGFIAFVMKCWEFYRDRRPWLRVHFAGVDPQGAIVLIFNLSKVATTIYHYSVHALPSTWLGKQWARFDVTETLVVSAREPIDVEVPARGQVRLLLGGDLEASMWRFLTAPDDLYVLLWTSTRRKPFALLLLTKRTTA